jgi:hypothetical protein
MTRQLISTNKQPLLRSSHAKRPPQNGFVQVGLPETEVSVLRASPKSKIKKICPRHPEPKHGRGLIGAWLGPLPAHADC